ncbi:MAG: hypothetical protein JXR53_04210 [Bacteroidales bacterium]|nr:hypothetical protein [Bacteroidales bacterium]
MLFLLLKGNEVKGQEIFDGWTCYRMSKRPTGIVWDLKADFSASKTFPVQKGNPSLLSFGFGHNFKNFTIGARYNYHKNKSGFGGYFRYFIYDNKVASGYRFDLPLTVFLESSLSSPLALDQYHEAFSFSYGIIVRDNTLAGVELFHSINTDMTSAVGYYSSFGVRLHYYLFVRHVAEFQF